MAVPEPGVVVIGSINHDLTVITPRHPTPGETVLGTDHFTGPGGKGANQAVAIARLGVDVGMVGRVGDDENGRTLLRTLAEAGVDTAAVEIDAEAPTGLAVITLDDRGENTIVVSPGANRGVEPGQVGKHAEKIARAAVCLAQLEVPVEAVAAAAETASGGTARFVLNLAPALELSPGLLSLVDVLVVNQGELAALTGSADPASVVEIEGPSAVVVTLGAQGAAYNSDGTSGRWIPPPIGVADTTGAGDAFCGALAAAMAGGDDLETAVRWAVAAGAIATTKPGAQSAMPQRSQVEAILERVRRA